MSFKPYENQEQYKPIAQKAIQNNQLERQAVVSKIADFLGIKKFGEAIGDTAFLYGTKEGRDLQKRAQAGDTGAAAGLSAITESAPTNKEIIGSAGMTAMNVLSGGLAGRAGKATSFVSKLGRGAATGYGFDVASGLEQNKETGEAIKPGLGTAIGGGLPVIGKGLTLSGNVVKHVASYLSGVPAEAIQTAFEKPQQISSAIKNLVKNDEEKLAIVNKAKQSLESIIEKKNTSYANSLKDIESIKGVSKLSMQGINKYTIDTLNKFKLIGENGKLDFTKSPFPKSQNNELKEVISRISDWKDKSAIGLNDLAKVIGGYRKGTAESKAFDKIILGIKNNVRKYVSDTVPEIGKMNEAYAKESDVIEQMVRELSLGEGKSPTTALNKLTSIFNRNSEFKKKLVARLGEEGGQKLIDDIVGSMFTEWFPRGLSSRILSGAGGLVIGATTNAPGAAMGAILASPRLLGKAATTLGKGRNILKKAGGSLTRDITAGEAKEYLTNIRPGLSLEEFTPRGSEARKTLNRLIKQYENAPNKTIEKRYRKAIQEFIDSQRNKLKN